jgi:hypothetical protein
MEPNVAFEGAAAIAAAGAAAAAEHPIHRVLRTCGLADAAMRATFIDIEGLDSLTAFAQLNGDADISEMAKRMASRSIAAGRVILGTMHIKRIQALVYWVKDHDRRGLVADPESWDEDAMTEAMERKEAEHNFDKIDVASIDPGKCRTDHGWDNWQIAFENKLNATLGAARVPIDYVVREDDPDDELWFTEEQERKYQMPLEGPNFKQDNKLVYKMLKAACVDTAAWAWLEKYDPTSDGRKAWMALLAHYNGYGELNKRTTRAKEELMKLHYKDEKAFSFEKYITKLKELFRVLDKSIHEQYSEPRQVEFMLHGISSSDVGIISAKTTVFASPLMKSDFDEAINFMSAYISSRHCEAQSKYAYRHNGQRRNVSATGSDGDRGGRGRGGRSGQRGGRGTGRGRGGRGRGNNSRMRSYINEVDVTDPHRNFTAAEWEKLGTMRGVVLRMRDGNGTSGRGGRGGNENRSQSSGTNRTTSGVSATETSNDNGNGNAEASVVSEITERGSQNGRSFGRGAYSNNN